MLNFTQFTKLNEDSSTFKSPSVLGSPDEAGHTIQGVHYSHHQGIRSLSGKKFGSGIKGAEHARLATATDPRIRSRVYFYNKQPGRLPRAEHGLGPHVHSSTLHGIFHPDHAKQEDRDRITMHKQKYLGKPNANPSNSFESALVDAGFRGYTNGHMTVVLNHDHVPVQYEGHSHALKAAA